jgi:hypothetical protein
MIGVARGGNEKWLLMGSREADNYSGLGMLQCIGYRWHQWLQFHLHNVELGRDEPAAAFLVAEAAPDGCMQLTGFRTDFNICAARRETPPSANSVGCLYGPLRQLAGCRHGLRFNGRGVSFGPDSMHAPQLKGS